MRRSTFVLFVVIIALIAVSIPILGHLAPVEISHEEEFNPCLETRPGACVRSGRWLTERAKSDADVRRILNTLEWVCADDPIVVSNDGQILIMAFVPCDVGNLFEEAP